MVAWAGFVFGSVVSVLANVLAARIAPAHSAVGWAPRLDTQIGAAVWPIALLLSVEVLSRIDWPTTWVSRLVRYVGVGAVALFSAVISYQHIRDVLISWSYPDLSAGVGPLVIDGLMIVSGFAMVVGSTVAVLPGPEPADEPMAAGPESTVPREPVVEPEPPMVPEPGPWPSADLPPWPTQELPDPFPTFGPEPAPQRVTVPVNGRKPVMAARKTGPKPIPKPKVAPKETGPIWPDLSEDQIVDRVRDRIAAEEQINKRIVQGQYGIGSDKALRVLRRARGEE